LRNAHSERLGALLKLGPRTRVDGATLARWIGEAEAARRVHGASWVPPALHLDGPALEFPVEHDALAAVLVNLLRNAQSAIADGPEPRAAIVRAGEERDAAGRRLLVLAVADSSQQALTMEMIESRESGRGLAIVRDLVHEWRGHLALRPDEAPYAKAVAACFPAA